MFEKLLSYSVSTVCFLCVVFVLKHCLGLVVLVPNFMSVA